MKSILSIIEKHKEYLEVHSYKKNTTIFFENDICVSVGIVKDGEISIKSYFSNGKEVTYNSLKNGELFGNNLIFSSSPFYRGDVIALTDVIIYFINKDNLLKLMKEDNDLLIAYLTNQSDFSKNLNFKIKLLTISSAEDRLIYYLTFNKNKLAYKSITKLADELYLSRESLSRTIAKLTKDHKIKRVGKTLILVV